MVEFWYNLTQINGTGMVPFIRTIDNTFMFNSLGSLFLIMFFAIIMYNLEIRRGNDTTDNLMISAFVTAIISLFFVGLQMVSITVPFVAWGLFALFLVIKLFTM